MIEPIFDLKYKNPINLLWIKRLWSNVYGENIIQEYIQEKIIRRFSSTSQNVYYKIKSINFKLKIITGRK